MNTTTNNAKGRLEKTEKMNAGLRFEIALAEKFGWTRDGRPGHVDLIDDEGRVVECKFFTDYMQEFDRKMYPAHLPAFDKSRPVLEQLREYCQTFDRLAIGHGNLDGEYTIEFIEDRETAYNFIAARLQAKGDSLELRIKYKAGTTKSGGDERVKSTIRRWGWII